MGGMYKPKTEIGRKILFLLKTLPVSSVSHGLDHHLRALKHAHKLHSIYGGDLEVIEAAVLLHDIAKLLDAKIENHAAISARIAESLLKSLEIKGRKIEKVKEAILHHDDLPFNCKERSLEARIVHDADWLDGFGAIGILRISMVAGEKGRKIDGIVKKIREGMKARTENLCFKESEIYAKEKWKFVEEFLAELYSELSF